MMRLATLVFVVVSLPSYAQFAKTDMRFVKYLMDKREFNDAIYLMQANLIVSQRSSEIDSLNFYLGKTYYYLQKLNLSNEYLKKVAPVNPGIYSEAIYFYSFNNFKINQFHEAESTLKKFKSEEYQHPYLKNFMLEGIALTERNFLKFDSLVKIRSGEQIEISKQQQNFLQHKNDMLNNKSKSSLVAGMLSAVVPGLGKIYAGKTGVGLYTFLTESMLAVQAYEGWVKGGASSARFLIYASLFTLVHISNIWGSSLSVKVLNYEKEEYIRQQIQFDIHIPLRTVFQ